VTSIRLDLTDGQTFDITLGAELSDGGEGRVHEIIELPGYCAKIYREPATQVRLEERLAELSHFGRGGWHLDDHPELTYPVGLCRGPDGACIGFAMSKLAWPWVPLDKVLLPAAPLRKRGQLTWEHQIHIAADVARVVGKLHKAGVVVADLCPDNLFVSPYDGRVALIDVDSFQIRGHDGRRYPSRMSRPDYGAPELAEQPEGAWRSHLSDLTPLGIVITQVLLDLVHPFDGHPKSGGPWDGDDRDARCIAAGLSWITDPDLVDPPNAAPDVLWILSPTMIRLMTECFSAGADAPEIRPEADEWVRELAGLAAGLQTCPTNPWHRFRSGPADCPWCHQARTTGRDPYPRPDTPGPELTPWLATASLNGGPKTPRKRRITPVKPRVAEKPEVESAPAPRPPNRIASTTRPAAARTAPASAPATRPVSIDHPTLWSGPPRQSYRWITPVMWVLGLIMVATLTYPVFVHYSGKAAAADKAADARKATATALGGLVTQSVAGRASLLGALADIEKCRINAKTRHAILNATASREALAKRVAAFDPSALPGGTMVKAELTVVLARSVEADKAYLRWYDAANGHCPKQTGKLFAAIGTANARAKAAKSLFLNDWNPMAAHYGLPKRDVNSI
jgi:serine/threonine protein kinase